LTALGLLGLHWINGFHSSPFAAIDRLTADISNGNPLGRQPPLAWRPPERSAELPVAEEQDRDQRRDFVSYTTAADNEFR